MSHSDDTSLIVSKDNRHTIGGIYADDNTLKPRYEGIHTLKRLLLLVNVAIHEIRVYYRHTARMRLSWHDQVIQVHAQGHRQPNARVKHPQCVIAHIVT